MSWSQLLWTGCCFTELRVLNQRQSIQATQGNRNVSLCMSWMQTHHFYTARSTICASGGVEVGGFSALLSHTHKTVGISREGTIDVRPDVNTTSQLDYALLSNPGDRNQWPLGYRPTSLPLGSSCHSEVHVIRDCHWHIFLSSPCRKWSISSSRESFWCGCWRCWFYLLLCPGTVTSLLKLITAAVKTHAHSLFGFTHMI